MTFVQKQRSELRKAIRCAWKQHRNVRAAAKSLGMPKSTFHELAHEFGIKTRLRGEWR